MTPLVVPPDLLTEVVTHCRDALPNEAGGLLAGVGPVVTRHFPLRNELASRTRYRSHPADTIAAAKACRDNGLDVLAVYHSHPTSAPVPSQRDLDERYGVLTLIVGLAGPEPEVRGWHLTATGYTPAAWSAGG
jgi:[CysO sulfur-carrier protein]-S-L-cysteine hydrolase